jgi:septal ring factor EnvC (AmiA/AmiB activator)
METINDLLKALDNKVPASIARRLDGLNKLNERLKIARDEHEANPTEKSKDDLDEIIQFISDTEEDLNYDISILVDKKRDLEAKAQEARKREQEQANKIAEEKASREKQEIAEREEREKQEAEKKAEEEALNPNEKTENKKKSGIGWGGLLLGGVLLVATGGAIKYFGNRK